MPCKRSVGVALLIGLVLSLSVGCGHLIYPSGPYSGRVVDADTNQPIAGVAVIATWTREIPIAPHMAEQDWDVYETLSDANGEFTIPHRTHFTVFGWIIDPMVVVYYPAYASFRSADLHPETPVAVTLKRLTDRTERVLNAGRPVGTLTLPPEKIPNLIRLIDEERRQLGLEPLKSSRAAP